MELVKTKYKKTEVGLIPEDWSAKLLGDVLKIKHGKDQKSVLCSNGDYPILGTGGLMGYANKFLFNKESVLIGRKGTIDKPRYMDSPFWTVDTLFYSEIKEGFLAKYIYYNFLLIDWYSYNEASGVPSLNAKTIENISIPLPPTIEEQKAIADALSDVDALITNLEKLITKKKEIKQGAMQQLLTPPNKGGKRLAGFTGEWELKTLGDVAKIKTGGKNNQDKMEDGLYPFFVRSQTIERINSYSFDGEAILIPGEGGIGTIYHYINGKFDVHQRVYKISDFETEIYGKFIYLKMLFGFYNHAMKNSVKATVDSLRLPTFLEFEVVLPPTKEEQIAISNVIFDIENEINLLEDKKLKYQDIKQGMMQELLTGKTRLI